MAAQRKYPDELRERAVKMLFEVRERDALDLLGVPGQEGVVVDDLHLGLQQRVPQVRGNQVALAVVVVVPFRV